MMYLITTWFGTFLCDSKGIQEQILFPQKEQDILKRVEKIQQHLILAEEKKIAKGKEVIVAEKRLQQLGTYEPMNPFFKKIQIKPEDFDVSPDVLHNVSHIIAKQKTEDKLKAEDLQVIQMVNAYDDLLHIENLLSERLAHWALIPTPEDKKQPFEQMVSTVGTEMKRLERQIGEDMELIAPNTSGLIGSMIGARLIALAGGLDRLALLPASTIQILGAEKAFFRFKKEGGKPPKHGVIFQHPLINKAPRDERGKIARIMAAKIGIAAKADAFTQRRLVDDLKTNMEQRIQEIRNK